METNTEQTVFKFRVTDGLGNASAIWRVWTGSNKPTDDTYLAPANIVKDIKVSLHKNGYCQIGPTPQLRNNSFAEDRAAFTRWKIDIRQVPGPLITLKFAKSEFRVAPPVEGVFDIVLPEGIEGVIVFVTKTHEPSQPICQPGTDGSWTIATLARADALTVVSLIGVFTSRNPIPEGNGSTVTQPSATDWSVWKMPVDWEDSPFGWAVSDVTPFKRWIASRRRGLRPIPVVMEFSADPSGDETVALPGFDGTVEPWASCPVNLPRGVDACALLAVTGEHGSASLYLNEHARCDHTSLARDANRVLSGFREFGPDEGWDPLLDAEHVQVGWRTALVTPSASLRSPQTKLPSAYRRKVARVERRLQRRRRRRESR